MAIIINYVERFASYTTMHGFRRIVDSKATPKRLAWIIVFATAWMFFTIHTSVVLRSYFEYPIKTTTSIVSDGVPFPDITLCNLGSLDFYAVYRLSKGISGALLREDEALYRKVIQSRIELLYEQLYSEAIKNGFMSLDHEKELQLARLLDYNFQTSDEYYGDADFYLNDTFTRAMYKFHELFRGRNVTNDSHRKAVYDKLFSRTTLSANILTQMLSANGVREKEFIVKCTFRNKPCRFKKIFDPYYFNCFTFTPPSVTSSNGEYPPLLEGIDNGFSVILLAGTRMLEQVDNKKFFELPGIHARDNPLSGAGGVRVVIHPPGSKPFPMTEGYDVPPERMASLGLDLKRQKRLGHPYGQCNTKYPFSVPEDRRLVMPYRRTTCQKTCIQHAGIYRKCKCFENTLPTIFDIIFYDDVNVLNFNETMRQRNFNIMVLYDDCLLGKHSEETNSSLKIICRALEKCSGTDDFHRCFNVTSDKSPTCDDKVLKKLLERITCAEDEKNNLMANATFLSECGCYPACDNVLYKVSYSLSQWPSHGIEGETVAHEIMDELNFTKRFTPEKKRKFYDDYRHNDTRRAMKDFSKINVYVSNADVFLTTEEPAMTVTDLISDIGGQLGVWIGVSVLTLAEVLEILITIVIDCCRKRNAKRNKAEADLKDAKIGNVLRHKFLIGDHDIISSVDYMTQRH